MKLNHIILILLVLLESLFSVSQKQILINFDNLKISDFIKITSKVIDKNILLTDNIPGTVHFISTKPLYKKNILNILTYILESKGYKIVENKSMIRILPIKKMIKKNKSVYKIINLKNAQSKNILPIIKGIIKTKKSKKSINKLFVSLDEESNSIILMGEKEKIDNLTTLIRKLDIHRQQVYVKAKIIEVSELKTRNVGLKYGLNGFTSSSGGLASFTSSLNGGTDVSTVDLTSLSTYGFDLTTMTNGLSLGMTLNLLYQNGAADIISEPSLLCINNKESSIYVGETRSIKVGTTTSTSGVTSDVYKREDIGLTLKVKPRISNGNRVLLEIVTKIEDVSQSNGANGQPNTSKKDIQTTAIVNNGESVILGGYIKVKKENTVDKVPFFGDIPILGSLFRNNKEISDKINLVIIITPYIIPKSKNLTYIRNKLSQLKFIEDKYTKEVISQLENENIKQIETQKLEVKIPNDKLHQIRIEKLFGI